MGKLQKMKSEKFQPLNQEKTNIGNKESASSNDEKVYESQHSDEKKEWTIAWYTALSELDCKFIEPCEPGNKVFKKTCEIQHEIEMLEMQKKNLPKAGQSWSFICSAFFSKIICCKK